MVLINSKFDALVAMRVSNSELGGATPQDYRHHLHIAETESSDLAGNKEIIMKFARQYSVELHAICADWGKVPKILGYQLLPRGWSPIAMGYISQLCTPSNHPISRSTARSG